MEAIRFPKTQVVAGEERFQAVLAEYTSQWNLSDDEVPAHERLDCALARAVEEVLVPKLGRWEQSDAWYHELDWNGDGVRLVAFSANTFSYELLEPLRQLLRGDFKDFCILCQVSRGTVPAADEGERDFVALFATSTVAMRALAGAAGAGV